MSGVVKKNNTTQVAFLGMAFLLIVVIVFYNIGFDFGIEGDDVFTISDYWREYFGRRGRGYINITQARHFLQISINTIYELVGRSTALTQGLFFSIWVLNGLLCFILLSKYYDPWLALLSSLLFLGYTGKYEVVPIMSGGMYHCVLALLLCGLLLMASNLKWWVKSISVTVLYWVSLHWYEILVPTAPLVPFCYYVSQRSEAREIRFRDFFLSFLPVFVTIVHVVFLAKSPTPIWNRSGSLAVSDLVELIPKAFFASLDSIAGNRHISIIRDNFQSARNLYEMDGYGGLLAGNALLGLAVAGVGLIVMLRSCHPADKKSAATFAKELWALPLLGLYLVFVCPLISIPIFKGAGFVASRFTYLPGLGLAFILCGVAACRYRGARWGALALLFIITPLEVMSMRMILFQYATAAIYDNNIRSQLKNYALNLNMGDTVFLSLPENGMINRVWKQGFSKFESGSAQPLLLLDNTQLFYRDESVLFDDRLVYLRHIRKRDSETDEYFLRFFEPDAPSVGRLFPFYLTQDNRLCAVNTVEVVDKTGVSIDKKTISNIHVPSSGCIKEITVPQAVISDTWIDIPRKIQVFTKPSASGITLRLRGELFAGDPPIDSYIAYGGNAIASLRREEVGTFSWDVKLPTGSGIYNLEIGNRVPPSETRRVLWKVLDIDVVP